MAGVSSKSRTTDPATVQAKATVTSNQAPDLSIFENRSGLADDLKFLASMPELCDITFLVGETREPVCAVRAILAARSRVFDKLLYQQPTVPSSNRKKDLNAIGGGTGGGGTSGGNSSSADGGPGPGPKENKLRMFLKRSSEPVLNLQNPALNSHQTFVIDEFEPDVFRQLIEFIHTSCVTLQPRTLLGVMNAADYYGLEELRKACANFVTSCINVDTVCALLSSAERYIQYKCTKSLVQKVLEFVDEHGNEVLNLGSFTLLPQHVVCLILGRDELQADEFTKFQAALMWSKKYCDNQQQHPHRHPSSGSSGSANSTDQRLKDTIANFLDFIQFHKIPAQVLMRDIHPLGLVPYNTIMAALAYQADPDNVVLEKLSPGRRRRSDHGRSMSMQSNNTDTFGSNTTLNSSNSSNFGSQT